MADGKVTVIYDGDTSGIDKANSEAQSKVSACGSKLGSIAKSAAVAIGAAFVAAGAAAFKFGTDFESAVAKASTLFGDVAVDTENLQSKLLELSDASGVAAADLGNTLYNALSAGIPATEDMGSALAFLEANTRLAKAGFTDVDTAVTTTAKILNAYKMDVSETEKIHKILMQTQNKGIVTVGELGSVLAQVTPTAAAFGVSFDQVGAAIANMTAQGTPAAQATTQLNSLFAELGKNGTTAANSLAAATEGTEYAGKSFQQLAAEGVPLNKILDLIGDYAEQSGLSMLDTFSSIEAGKAALANAGQNSQAFADALAAMGTEADVVGDAFDKVSGTTAEQFAKILNELKNAAIELFIELAPIVEQLLPVLKDVLGKLVPVLSNIVQKFLPILVNLIDKLLPPILKLVDKLLPVLVALINALLPILTMLIELLKPILDLFIALLEPILELLMSALTPLLELFTAILQPILDLIMLALTPLLELIQPIIDIIMALMDTALRPLMDVFSSVFGVIVDTVLVAIGSVTDILGGIMDFVKNVFAGNWSGAWESIKNVFTNIWEGIKNVGKSALNGLISIFKTGLNGIIGFINGITQGVSKVWDWTGIPSIPKIPEVKIPRLKVGADFIPQDFFPAYLDYGERVLTAEQNNKFSQLGGLEGMERALGGTAIARTEGGGDVHVVVQGDVEMDGFKVGTVVMRNIDDVKKFT